MADQSLWVLKTVEDKDRSYKTVESYNDKATAVYNYDSKVANHKNIKVNDLAILVNKEFVLGVARISAILHNPGTKEIRRCPIEGCSSTTIDLRKNKMPIYRCNKGHEFDSPIVEAVPITRFSAHYPDSFISYLEKSYPVQNLRKFYIKNYNQNMSMQRLDMNALYEFDSVLPLLQSDRKAGYLLPTDAASEETQLKEPTYTPRDTDERKSIFQQIKARRGQQKFRNDLRKRYGDTCMVTGCNILDILEAAHINPYRGLNDNHPANGLLLRADIHTLFDLDLIGIEPLSLTVTIHQRLKFTEYQKLSGKKLIIDGLPPSKKTLTSRWQKFNSKHTDNYVKTV